MLDFLTCSSKLDASFSVLGVDDPDGVVAVGVLHLEGEDPLDFAHQGLAVGLQGLFDLVEDGTAFELVLRAAEEGLEQSEVCRNLKLPTSNRKKMKTTNENKRSFSPRHSEGLDNMSPLIV